MDWITAKVAIGNYVDALDFDLLRREKVESALSLDGTLYGKNPIDCGLTRIEVVRLEDAPGNDPRLFRLAVDYLCELVQKSPAAIVQCHAGRSRSAVVVAGYLAVSQGMAADDALQFVASKREISVTVGLERLLDSLG